MLEGWGHTYLADRRRAWHTPYVKAPLNPRDAALALGLKATAALLVDANGDPVSPKQNAFLSGLLLADPDSILERFEAHAQRAFASPGVNLRQLIKPERLLGAEEDFHDACAELVTASWFSSLGVLEVPKQLAGPETLSGKAHGLDGALSAGGPRSKQVLFDVKNLRPQARRQVDVIEQHISSGIAQELKSTAVSIHLKGSLQAGLINPKDRVALIARGINLLPVTPPGQEIELGEFAGCRVMAQIRVGPQYRTGFWSGVGQVKAERAEFWPKLKQLPRSRPFLLVLVRTYAEGLKHVGMAGLLDEVLRGHEDEPSSDAVFGHATSEMQDKPRLPRRELQLHLSGVYFIDDEHPTGRLFTNSHAVHPLPQSLKARLRKLAPPFS